MLQISTLGILLFRFAEVYSRLCIFTSTICENHSEFSWVEHRYQCHLL